MNILTVDFGSTYTKVTAINEGIIGTAKAFTTVETDIGEGLRTAMKELEKQTGKISYEKKLAASSAAGGLKMVAVGLVPGLTAKAAHLAATSAGAKVIKTYSYELSRDEMQEIHETNPDLVLLSGGTDGGNKEVIIKNAKNLAEIDRGFPVIVAGNKTVRHEVQKILMGGSKHAVGVDNVMPTLDSLDIMPAKAAINRLFMEKIVEAKGLGEVSNLMDAPIIPTPLAVFLAAEIASNELGTLAAVDVGGATTDVYSVTEGAPTKRGVIPKGLPEPYTKRSVEGDIGMRYSLESLIEAEPKSEGFGEFLAKCARDPSYVPKGGTNDGRLDALLCTKAVKIALQRHSGFLEKVYTPMGEAFYQFGKDLTDVKYLVGIGGALVFSEEPKKILEDALKKDEISLQLTPKNPHFLFDKKYIFAAMGLLSQVNKKLAAKIMLREVTP